MAALPAARAAPPMIAFRLRAVLEERGITAYQLARGCDIPMSTAYRLASGEAPERLDLALLERVCRFLALEPGDLLQLTRGKR